MARLAHSYAADEADRCEHLYGGGPPDQPSTIVEQRLAFGYLGLRSLLAGVTTVRRSDARTRAALD
jgi:hypothetical protein